MQCGEAVRERLSCTAALLANSIAVQAGGVREREREGVLNVRSVWRECGRQRQENSLTYKGAAEKSQRVAACNAANYKMAAATPTPASTSTSTQAA